MEEKRLYEVEEIIPLEDEFLKDRRKKLQNEAAESLERNRFGIALSGGGIRSATINLGFLKTLNKFGIIKNADYLSTVSGGGYCGSYIQTTLKSEGSYDKLFTDEQINYMRNRGSYLVPGKGIWKLWNQLVLVVGFLVSWVLSLVSPAIILFLAYGVLYLLGLIFDFNINEFFGGLKYWGWYALLGFGGLMAGNYIFNVINKYHLDGSSFFHKLQTGSIFIGLIGLFLLIATSFGELSTPNFGELNIPMYLLFALLAIVIGFFSSPNATSFHRYYRSSLAGAFLNFAGNFKNVPLHDLFQTESENEADYLAPYPMVNTCLNLQATDDPKFKGSKTSDYFLLSPKFCGSKLTNYVRSDQPEGYSKMTFPAAVTISAAAVNPGMGRFSNKTLAILTTVFNLRLGYWTWNPLKTGGRIPIVWWPVYFFYELFSQMGTDKKMLNISDGGHIENLAVYELLRRKCRLIIGVDAGEDSNYSFEDLEVLTARARNELGIEIRFRKEQIPEEVIRPKPSRSYSQQRHAIADLLTVWEEILMKDKEGNILYKEVEETNDAGEKVMVKKPVEALINYFYDINEEISFDINLKYGGNYFEDEKLQEQAEQLINYKLDVERGEQKGINKLKFGTFIYVKSSVTAPKGKPAIRRDDKDADLKYGTYKYKIYHPKFPHEPTSDQFFDKIQWEAYYQLGQFIGAEVLDIPDFMEYHSGQKEGSPKSIDDLIAWFDNEKSLFPPTQEEKAIARSRGISAKVARKVTRGKKIGYEM